MMVPHFPKAAIISHTSNIHQDDVGNYFMIIVAYMLATWCWTLKLCLSCGLGLLEVVQVQ